MRILDTSEISKLEALVSKRKFVRDFFIAFQSILPGPIIMLRLLFGQRLQ